MDGTYHVKPHEDGKWQVIRTGNERATRVFDTKNEAIVFAKDLTQEKDMKVVTHDQSGEVETPTEKPSMIKSDKMSQESIEPEDVSTEAQDMIIEPSIQTHVFNKPVVDEPVIKELTSDKETKSGFFTRFYKRLFGKK